MNTQATQNYTSNDADVYIVKMFDGRKVNEMPFAEINGDKGMKEFNSFANSVKKSCGNAVTFISSRLFEGVKASAFCN